MAEQCSLPPQASPVSSLSRVTLQFTPPAVWQSSKFKALMALCAVYLIWGTTMAAMRFGVETIPPGVFAFSRYLLVTLLLLSYCISKKEAWPTPGEIKRHVFSGVCLFFVGNATAIWAMQYLPTVLGGALTATTPFWMIGLAALKIGDAHTPERISRVSAMGLGLGFIGIITILAPQLLQLFNASNPKNAVLDPLAMLAILAMLISTASWALGSWHAKRTPTKNSVWMEVGIQNLSATILMLPFCLPDLISLAHPSGGFNGAGVTPLSVASLLYLVLAGTILAMPCYLYVLHHLPISVTSTFAYVCPIITMLIGYSFLGEALSPTMAFGSGMILLGVILVQVFQKKRRLKGPLIAPTPITPAPPAQRVA
ncbi:MAG: EamA family transporter [Vampirovibrionales bacterium]|nr:EamA family transporter [Vampirovibrionales bacterium]